MRARVTLILLLLGLAIATIASPVAAGLPVASADLAITKSDTPDPVAAGATLSYAVTIENLGPDDATGVSWTDTFPPQLAPGLQGWPAGWTPSTVGNTITFTASAPLTVAAGPQQFLLEFTVNPSVPDGTILTNSATVTSSAVDPTPANNSASAQTTVVAPPPAASLADAATAPPATGSPLATLGFGLLLIGALSAMVMVNVRRVVRGA
jgi:uncharacterized repeat protein (TIGR01451 family)